MNEKLSQLLLCFECKKSYKVFTQAKFCGGCGKKLMVACPHCNAQFLVEEYERCVYCGKEYKKDNKNPSFTLR